MKSDYKGLKIIITDKGIDVYYQLTNNNGNYHIIQLNRKLFSYNKKLFYWMLHNKLRLFKETFTQRIEIKHNTPEYIKRKKVMMKSYTRFLMGNFNLILEYYKKKKYYALDINTPIPDKILSYDKGCKKLSKEDEDNIISYIEGL